MNKRLADAYSSIEDSNRDAFLSNNVEIDKQWGQPVWGITLQIDLSESVRDALCLYQKELDELEPSNLLLLPRQYQHISFNQIVFWGGMYAEGREQTWKAISADFTKKFLGLNNEYPSFGITFSKMISTTGGIIWCAVDENDEMEKLRSEFFAKLPFPKETTKQNHIIHTTVARFVHKLNNPVNVLNYVKKKTHTSSMIVDRIILRNELIFPSIRTETLGEIRLK